MSHKKRDWSEYNKSRVNRGSITLWIEPKVLKAWNAKREKQKLGRPFKFSDTAIITAPTIRYLLKLSLRACEGFLKSLLRILKTALDVPC